MKPVRCSHAAYLEYLRTKDPTKFDIPEDPNNGLSSTPLLEVFSVSIHPNLQDCDTCEIYGIIKVTNGLGHAFDLYNRDEHNAESIKVDNTGYSFLSLTGPKDNRVIIPYEFVRVDVIIRDRAQDGIVIAQGEFSLNYKETSFYTEHGAQRVLGEAGFVTLHYATFPYAVMAYVDVLFFSKYDDFDTLDDDIEDYEDYEDYTDYSNSCGPGNDVVADVSATVTARSNFPSSSSFGDSITTSSILLNMSHDQCVRVKSRTIIDLSRSLVAVPAYSPLQIHVDFKCDDGSKLAKGVLEFQSSDWAVMKKDLVGENGRIRVRVKWSDAYKLRDSGSDLKRMGNEVSSFDEVSSSEERVKRQRLQADSQPSSALIDWLPPSPKRNCWELPVQLVEVFSVGIGSNDLKPPFKLYGKIYIDFSYLFNRDESSPQTCLDKVAVSFCSDGGIMASDDFGIYVDLKDVEGNVLKGQVGWPSRVLRSWYDKRICSLIRGDHGYVALHYTVFYDGVQASVKVFVKRTNSALCLTTKLYGSLVARYSTHKYLTSYDKKYYQSVLFESGSDDPVNLTKDGSLPLLKSLVCAPRKSSLIIEADLAVDDNLRSQLGVGVDALQGIVEFDADGGQSCKQIQGKDYFIDVLVAWPEVW